MNALLNAFADWLKPIDALTKLIVNLLLWWVGDAIGNVTIIFLSDALINISTNPLLYIPKPIFLFLINIYTLYSNIKDVREFIEEVKHAGFHLY